MKTSSHLQRIVSFFSQLPIYLIFLCLVPAIANGQATQNQPTSEGAATLTKEESPTELTLRLGNESNPVDGVFGPLTYGFRASHKFENSSSLEVGLIRLHEPKTPFFNSVLDEGQLSVHLPEQSALDISATLWKNRTIDMYTNLIGVEVARKSAVTLMFGLYAGTATLDEFKRDFRGAQLAISGTIEPVELNLGCLVGTIQNGNYRKCGVEGAVPISKESPISLSFATEERSFNFGDGGPISGKPDEFIFITALEFKFEGPQTTSH